jgi:hypothetical protein
MIKSFDQLWPSIHLFLFLFLHHHGPPFARPSILSLNAAHQFDHTRHPHAMMFQLWSSRGWGWLSSNSVSCVSFVFHSIL